ncbi:aminodeoxychorismate lyase [Winogradskya consettensis]|uniref:Aminotransferase, class IV n=1 Tax=Winogradskya consettensis TaxID=113560 RepID=A0A919SS56_9ACTN|nr:aminotransferase class IV [Actinoplanes consettensis]GIM78030.1 putative aminotransferase, class IV [Actinoplanes consettensis]
MSAPILVIPGSGELTATDRGLLYGEGVFETVHLRPDGPWELGPHLERLARSAALLGLTVPHGLADLAAGLTHEDGALRLVVTPATSFATVSDVPQISRIQRRDGIRLITHDLGLTKRPPWSLSGAKTISYAENLAAKRWAELQGADDLLWLTSDGYALEGPTASLVWLSGDTLCTVPAEPTGILPGTTAAKLLSSVVALGLRTEERMISVDELAEADAIWLVSSLRGLAEARTLNGSARAASPWTPRLLGLLGFIHRPG